MSLTVTEAQAVNDLLAWLICDHNDPQVPDHARALAAAELLAEHANKTLGAGIRPEHVTVAWPDIELPGAVI
jgi:hypothetical protein